MGGYLHCQRAVTGDDCCPPPQRTRIPRPLPNDCTPLPPSLAIRSVKRLRTWRQMRNPPSALRLVTFATRRYPRGGSIRGRFSMAARARGRRRPCHQRETGGLARGRARSRFERPSVPGSLAKSLARLFARRARACAPTRPQEIVAATGAGVGAAAMVRRQQTA